MSLKALIKQPLIMCKEKPKIGAISDYRRTRQGGGLSRAWFNLFIDTISCECSNKKKVMI